VEFFADRREPFKWKPHGHDRPVTSPTARARSGLVPDDTEEVRISRVDAVAAEPSMPDAVFIRGLPRPSAKLEEGISLTDINRTLRQVHPRGEELNPGNVAQELKSAASLQVQLGIKPLILDYHQSARRLSVVDRGFLIWLSYQDKDDLLATAGLPSSEPESTGQLTLRREDAGNQ
jgi:hypothetical protein